MPEYYILEKVKCYGCEGVGWRYDGRPTPDSPERYAEKECDDCKGDGFIYDQIELNQEILDNIRREFMGEHNV